jgi:hypothetical protein
MGKLYKILSLTALLVLLTGCSAYSADYDALPDPTQTAQPTETPIPTESPTPEPLIYWPDGLKVVDITDRTSRSCTFDMCVFLKLTAVKTCSSISIDGTTYTADDEEFDSFSDDFPRLKKGSSRVVEFGTDATDDSEDYVEMDSATCWK